jgi:hypothetical protein
VDPTGSTEEAQVYRLRRYRRILAMTVRVLRVAGALHCHDLMNDDVVHRTSVYFLATGNFSAYQLFRLLFYYDLLFYYCNQCINITQHYVPFFWVHLLSGTASRILTYTYWTSKLQYSTPSRCNHYNTTDVYKWFLCNVYHLYKN